MGSGNFKFYVLWLGLSLIAGAALASVMFVGGSRQLLLVGETTGVHHQMEMACESCHTAPFNASEKKSNKSMTKACLACHKDELGVSNDSHPVKKFRDPRNVERLEVVNALYCQSCHVEHTPELTRPVAVTLPTDFCVACHEDVGDNRPTHEGVGFDTCASAGCHNYHDNTALYEKFLLKHAEAPDFAEHAVMAYAALSRGPQPLEMALAAENPLAELQAYLEGLEKAPKDPAAEAAEQLGRVLTASDASAPAAYKTKEAVALWAGSGHALGGVNCAGCHVPEQEQPSEAEMAEMWIEEPRRDVCATCHKPQNKSFLQGLHGMSAHPKISEPRDIPDEGVGAWLGSVFQDQPIEPMQVGSSRLETKPGAAHLELGSCNACHKPHEVNLEVAAVDACASCHDSAHTKNYFTSPHHELWRAEIAGDLPPGAGVSCADCHLPKLEDRRAGFVTTHNQNAYLRPNEKMIRPVCMSCHSLEFSIDALADAVLVENNFNGRPEVHIESIDWATSREGGEK